MKIRTTAYELGTGIASVTVPAPIIDVRFREHIVLVLRGWGDRLANRAVADVHATHFLHGLQNQCRRGELDVRHGFANAQARLKREKAAATASANRAAPGPIDVPSQPRGGGAEHFEWIKAQRRAKERASQITAHAAASEAAVNATAAITIELETIELEAAEVAAMWREAYGQRAAVYTRARFTAFGLRAPAEPKVPDYVEPPKAKVSTDPLE